MFQLNTATLTTTYTDVRQTSGISLLGFMITPISISSPARTRHLPHCKTNLLLQELVDNFANPSTLHHCQSTIQRCSWVQRRMEDFRFYTDVASAGNNAAFVENIRKAIAPPVPVISSVYPDGSSLMQGTNKFSLMPLRQRFIYKHYLSGEQCECFGEFDVCDQWHRPQRILTQLTPACRSKPSTPP